MTDTVSPVRNNSALERFELDAFAATAVANDRPSDAEMTFAS